MSFISAWIETWRAYKAKNDLWNLEVFAREPDDSVGYNGFEPVLSTYEGIFSEQIAKEIAEAHNDEVLERNKGEKMTKKDPWSDPVNSDPIKDVEEWSKHFRKPMKKYPRVLIAPTCLIALYIKQDKIELLWDVNADTICVSRQAKQLIEEHCRAKNITIPEKIKTV